MKRQIEKHNFRDTKKTKTFIKCLQNKTNQIGDISKVDCFSCCILIASKKEDRDDKRDTDIKEKKMKTRKTEGKKERKKKEDKKRRQKNKKKK